MITHLPIFPPDLIQKMLHFKESGEGTWWLWRSWAGNEHFWDSQWKIIFENRSFCNEALRPTQTHRSSSISLFSICWHSTEHCAWPLSLWLWKQTCKIKRFSDYTPLWNCLFLWLIKKNQLYLLLKLAFWFTLIQMLWGEAEVSPFYFRTRSLISYLFIQTKIKS